MELTLHELAHVVTDFLLLEFFEDILKKAIDHELLGRAFRDASLEHVEELFRIELTEL
ncbi:MAG TPA: hypothetical protein PKX94_11155 [Opitutales bacterium]|nr:hypothetical protein [Opitutales bacterium]